MFRAADEVSERIHRSRKLRPLYHRPEDAAAEVGFAALHVPHHPEIPRCYLHELDDRYPSDEHDLLARGACLQ